jgi:IPTL-CTERM motif
MTSAHMMRNITVAALAALAIGTFPMQAGAFWDEALNGDLSNDGLSPTTVSVITGSTPVIGTTGNSGSGVDRDYFKIDVPPGATLTAIMLRAETNVSGGSSFIGIQPGPQMTVTPSGVGADSLVVRGHYDNGLIGSDLLALLQVGTPGPLPSGTYSVWVQETGGPATYGLDFVISGSSVSSASVPTLPEWGMILLGLLMALAYWRWNAGSRGWRAPR